MLEVPSHLHARPATLAAALARAAVASAAALCLLGGGAAGAAEPDPEGAGAGEVDAPPPAAPVEPAPAASPAASPATNDPAPAAPASAQPPAAAGDTPAPPPEEAEEELDEDSFGLALESLGFEVVLSGYGDVVFEVDTRGESTFDVTHFNLIIGAKLSESVRSEVEIEYEHGGSEIKVEYAFIDFTIAPALTIRVGKYLVPVGRFNEVLHPSFRWDQITRPAMFREVVPAVWSDVGILLMGSATLGAGTVFEYDAFVANGLGDDIDLTAHSEPIRQLRGNNRDIDQDKGFGGRLGLKLFQQEAAGATELGVSIYSGGIGSQDGRRYSVVDVDLSLKLGDLRFRGEFAQSFFGQGGDTFATFERGLYGELSYLIAPITLTARWDYTAQRPNMGPTVTRHQLVPGILLAPKTFWSLRIEAVLPFDSALALGDVGFGAMAAFVF